MPFRNYTQFDTDTLDKMRAAYDAALLRLNVPSDSPLTSTLAATIAGLADEGERDVRVLIEKAIYKLEAAERKSKRT